MELNPLVKKNDETAEHVVRSNGKRIEAQDSLDDFPTPTVSDAGAHRARSSWRLAEGQEGRLRQSRSGAPNAAARRERL
jgi:hypothetical protein